ncbi:MAG: hypothetical protein ABI613_11360 [Gemmatimonadota bacterium]
MPLAAQTDSASPVIDSTPVRLLVHNFTTPSREFVRLRLVGGEIYRVELSDGRVKLDIHPLDRGLKSPPVRQRTDDAHSATYDVSPRTTGEYEIRVLGSGDHTVTLTVNRLRDGP